MTITDQIKYWFELSEEDILVAESNFQNNHFVWCLFLCHLSLEKSLKALFVQKFKETPPKVHDLLKLAKSLNFNIENEMMLFFNEMNRFNIEARYPEYKNNIKNIASYEFTKERLFKTKEALKWLKSQMK